MVFSACHIWTLFTCYLHMYMSSTHYLGHMRIMHTLFAVVLVIFLPNRQYQCHPYVISSIIYISYHIKLSFCTLSTQTYIVNAIWMVSTHVHIICLSSLTLLIYPIIHNLVFAHCLHTHTLSMSSLYCLQMHILCTSQVLLLLFTYVHVIRILSENIHIMCTLCAVVLDMFLPNRQMLLTITIFLLWQELVIEWNLSQEYWVVSFQDHVNDLWHNLCWWFSLHVTSGHCSHVICICTCHPHIIWAYVYYAHIICSGPWYIPS